MKLLDDEEAEVLGITMGGGGKLVLGLVFALTLQVTVVDAASPRKQNDACRFPSEWRGRYFQSGLGEIIIRDNVITTKGTCVERSQDYFLFENRENNCFQCLILIRQHRNVIQYKESYCSSSSVLKTVCTQLRVELPLYTLVREQASVVKCPFSDAFYFNYNDLVHGSCPRALSYAKPCSGQTKYQLRFNHCVDTAMFNGRDIDLECLATWKDGSEMYLYGRLNGPGLYEKDDQYRCFKYQHYGTDLQMAMSADATCRGLRSAMDGPFLIDFTRDVAGWPSPSCLYPEWLRTVTWRDLDDQWRLSVDENAQILHMTSQPAPTVASATGKQRHGQLSDNYEYRCRQIDNNAGGNDVIIHSFTIQNCIAKYQCIKLRRLSSQAVEIRYGTLSDQDGYARCTTDVYKTSHVLIPAVGALSLAACPRSAVYHTSPVDGCLHRLTVGCQNESIIVINHSCSPNSPGVLMECLASWNNSLNTASYVIVRQQQTNFVECFSYRLEGGKPVFGTDVSCSGNSTTPSARRREPISNYSITRSEQCRINAAHRHPPINGHQTALLVTSSLATTTPVLPSTRTSRPHHKKTTTHRLTTTTTRPPSTRPTTTHRRPISEFDDEDDDDVIGDSDRNYRPRFDVAEDLDSSGDDANDRRRSPAVATTSGAWRKLVSVGDRSSGTDDVISPPSSHGGRDRAPKAPSPEPRRPMHTIATDSSRRRDAVTSGRTLVASDSALSSSSSVSWRRRSAGALLSQLVVVLSVVMAASLANLR